MIKTKQSRDELSKEGQLVYIFAGEADAHSFERLAHHCGHEAERVGSAIVMTSVSAYRQVYKQVNVPACEIMARIVAWYK